MSGFALVWFGASVIWYLSVMALLFFRLQKGGRFLELNCCEVFYKLSVSTVFAYGPVMLRIHPMNRTILGGCAHAIGNCLNFQMRRTPKMSSYVDQNDQCERYVRHRSGREISDRTEDTNMPKLS